MIFIYLIDRAFLGLMVLEMLAKVVFEMHAFLNLPVLEMPCLYTTLVYTLIYNMSLSFFVCLAHRIMCHRRFSSGIDRRAFLSNVFQMMLKIYL